MLRLSAVFLSFITPFPLLRSPSPTQPTPFIPLLFFFLPCTFFHSLPPPFILPFSIPRLSFLSLFSLSPSSLFSTLLFPVRTPSSSPLSLHPVHSSIPPPISAFLHPCPSSPVLNPSSLPLSSPSPCRPSPSSSNGCLGEEGGREGGRKRWRGRVEGRELVTDDTHSLYSFFT